MFNLWKTSLYDLQIFAGIEKEIVDEIVAGCPNELFKKGEIIMEQGDTPDGKGYIIRSGTVKVEVNNEEVSTLEQGEFFGEIALLNEEERSATITATKDLETIVLSQDDIFTMIENDENNINKEIMRRMEENLENE